ncbi:Tat pathway signal sequence domain protein [Streptacidiphilus sp. P02-A3a]|uniref:Tat pathway signal sequence domain protein n=1 Tax=Streptacidiphilus sp. P02-A3a TaxID=2704468 RepID=UPI0015F9987E|nr:Tat pathway signal sequence domain protein [Streptacidiphilus sp. P02-A3a]QMU70704.1 Tat pathway signal sequence domain protein [Streptacidiphilus sp. P02-A3a]
MRSLRYSLPALLACALATVGMTGTAHAAPSAAATPVLSLSALGGPAANPGDLLTSSLTPGTTLSLTSTPSGGQGLFCQQSVWGGQLLANPPLPGPAVIRLLNPLTISACTDNSPTVTAVTGVAVSGLPQTLQVTGVGAFPLQLLPTSGPLQITVTLATTAAPSVVCTYQAPGPLTGNTALGSSPWRFVNQQFNLVSGPLPACGTTPNGFLTAAYSPVIDTTAGGANVFVN